MIESTTKYPLDFTKLEVGDYFDIPTLERITKYKHHTPQYGFACRNLQAQILHRTNLTVKFQGQFEMRILTHNEASIYNQKLFFNGLAKAERRHEKTKQVDETALTVEERTSHLHRLNQQSLIMRSITKPIKWIKSGKTQQELESAK